MKTKIFIFIFLILLGQVLSAQVNGQITYVEDRYILHVWGNHYERGYATGYLMAENIMYVFRNYVFTTAANNSVATYNYALNYYLDHYISDTRYLDEITGMVAGLQDSQVDMYHQNLQRDIGVNDLLFVNAIVDLGTGHIRDLTLGCSSLSSWGVATQNDPALQGNLTITRLLDWNRNTALIANPLMVVHHPSEPDEQKWISFTYPGLIGALSAISQSKSAAFMNVGNQHPNQNTEDLSSVLLNIRSGLERIDYDGNGSHSPEDLYTALATANHLSGSIIHNVQQWPDSSNAVIIETNNNGCERRVVGEMSDLAGSNLAATNHFRKLINPVPCYRYARIIDSLAVNPEVDALRQWQIMQGAGATQNNLMMIQYQPALEQVLWAIADPYSPAHALQAVAFDTQELFTQPIANIDDMQSPSLPGLGLYPNPLRGEATLRTKQNLNLKQVEVYNLKGQIVFTALGLPRASDFPANGVYFIKTQDQFAKSYIDRILVIR